MSFVYCTFVVGLSTVWFFFWFVSSRQAGRQGVWV